jgi:hypothetical protein
MLLRKCRRAAPQVVRSFFADNHRYLAVSPTLQRKYPDAAAQVA